MCPSHRLVIGVSIGPHACSEPGVAFSCGDVDGGVAGDCGGVCAFGGDWLKRVLSK